MALWKPIFFGIFALALSGGDLLGQSPVYFNTKADAVTGDNPRRSFTHPISSCSAGTPCYLPDANPASGRAVDSYTRDAYERPTSSGSGASLFYPAVDIVSARVGYDAQWIYYRIDLFGTEANGLPYFYAFEINYDADVPYDMVVQVEAPTAKVGTTFGSSGVMAWMDQNNNVGAQRPLLPDGPGNSAGGYETIVFSNGTNSLPGAPGGSTAIRARIVPGTPNSVEIAVSRSFLASANGGVAVNQASFRAWAGKGAFDARIFYLHDERSRSSAGSPYPWLRLSGAPATCPATSDAGLTETQRNALDSGTPEATSFINPCYPSGGVYEIDNSGEVGEDVIVLVPSSVNLAVTVTDSPDPVVIGDTLTYRAVVRNLTSGTGQATGVVLVDTLPSTVSFLSVTASQGSCSGTSVVTCSLGLIPHGDSVVVTIRVRAPTTIQTLNLIARVSSVETESFAADNRVVATTEVVNPAVVVTPDGGDPVPRLPSTTSAYSFSYTVRNPGTSTLSYHLLGYPQPVSTSFITVDSITGPGVTRGTRADSARIDNVPAGVSREVQVWYRTAGVASGSIQGMTLLARSTLLASVSDTGWVHITVVRPALALQKQVEGVAQASPGDDIAYSISLRNSGTAAAVAVAAVDALPAGLMFKIGSMHLAEGSTAFIAEFSSDGTSWSHVPASGGCGAPAGYDGCVTGIRWRLPGELLPSIEPAARFVFSARLR
jgi:uncharacterized repeat protein (TIGR01451 family)